MSIVSSETWLAAALGARRGRRHLRAGVGEDAPQAAAECEHDDDDQRRDAGDQEAVLDGGSAALLHLREPSVQHDAEVVQHGVFLLQKWVPRDGAGMPRWTQ